MLKRAKKKYKECGKNVPSGIYRQLEARQLALKYVANVTYGYTSATFSGRCCCPPVADAIVGLARATLTNAINTANKWGQEETWKGAKVVYGDTDSLFIEMAGRSVKEAFEFGRKLCDHINHHSPEPVNLKLEKVYDGSMLQTKKRYCGMMYESPTQMTPEFEAKGIETVRKDQCKLVQAVLKGALLTFFKTKGKKAALRRYLERQWMRILRGQLPLKYFIFTGRVRSMYKDQSKLPVAAVLAKRLQQEDPGFAIHNRERIPYVLVTKGGGAEKYLVRDCSKTPIEVMESWGTNKIHYHHYVRRILNPALSRCFSLPGCDVDVDRWFDECSKPQPKIHFWPHSRTTVVDFFGCDVCSFCGKRGKVEDYSQVFICADCLAGDGRIRRSLFCFEKYNNAIKRGNELGQVCSSCNGCIENYSNFGVDKVASKDFNRNNFGGHSARGGIITPMARCVNIDCDVLYARHMAREAELEAKELLKQLKLM